MSEMWHVIVKILYLLLLIFASWTDYKRQEVFVLPWLLLGIAIICEEKINYKEIFLNGYILIVALFVLTKSMAMGDAIILIVMSAGIGIKGIVLIIIMASIFMYIFCLGVKVNIFKANQNNIVYVPFLLAGYIAWLFIELMKG